MKGPSHACRIRRRWLLVIASRKSNAAYRGTGCQPVKQIGNLLHGITFLKVNKRANYTMNQNFDGTERMTVVVTLDVLSTGLASG